MDDAVFGASLARGTRDGRTAGGRQGQRRTGDGGRKRGEGPDQKAGGRSKHTPEVSLTVLDLMLPPAAFCVPTRHRLRPRVSVGFAAVLFLLRRALSRNLPFPLCRDDHSQLMLRSGSHSRSTCATTQDKRGLLRRRPQGPRCSNAAVTPRMQRSTPPPSCSRYARAPRKRCKQPRACMVRCPTERHCLRPRLPRRPTLPRPPILHQQRDREHSSSHPNKVVG
jgi:hypothetical protein